jgi:hypothetical protein
MIDKSRPCWEQDNYAKPKCDPKNNFGKWNTKKIQQKPMDENNRCFICRKEFEENNSQSPDRIDCHLAHTLENIVLTCVPCNKARSNQSLELVQTLVQLKQYAIDSNYPLVLTNESVIRQLQDAILGGLSNVWDLSNVAEETHINYLRYDKGKRKVYSIDGENVVTDITGVDFNALYPSAYLSIHNEMIGYTGNKMLMIGNFKEYTAKKEKII